MKKKKILITGGSGFIGTHLVEYFLTNNFEVLNIDLQTPKITSHHFVWKKINICHAESFKQEIISFSPHLVIHLAARTDLNGKTLDDYESNTIGVSNLIDALNSVNTLEKVIFTSSMYVCKPGYKPSDYEDYHPHTVYGESKVISEKLIKNSSASYAWSIIRPTSIWGPYFGEPYNLFFKIVLSGKYFHMGDRACKKTYGYIQNTVEQVISILRASKDDSHERVFYLGDYEPYNISEWADEIALLSNKKIPKVPFLFFRTVALFGDILKFAGINFPMTSFRLKNMTTDNIHDLSLIKSLTPELSVGRLEGTKTTINWINS